MQFEDFSILDEDNMSVDSMFGQYMPSITPIIRPANFFKWTSLVSVPYRGETRMKKVKVGVYETSTLPLTSIRRAITGTLTHYKVGTRDEDHFFVVNMATAPQGRRTPARLYFDSPYDFEKHCMVQVKQEIKTQWQNKQMELEKRNRDD